MGFREAVGVANDPALGDGHPARMTHNEWLAGYGVVALMLIVGVLNIAMRHASGAPKHPEVWGSYIALVIALALAVSLRWHSRMVSPFVAVAGAFFLNFAAGPTALVVPHLVVLFVTLAWCLMLTTRQRRTQKNLTPQASSADRKAAMEARRRRKKGEPEPPPAKLYPNANRRYTPPKQKS